MTKVLNFFLMMPSYAVNCHSICLLIVFIISCVCSYGIQAATTSASSPPVLASPSLVNSERTPAASKRDHVELEQSTDHHDTSQQGHITNPSEHESGQTPNPSIKSAPAEESPENTRNSNPPVPVRRYRSAQSDANIETVSENTSTSPTSSTTNDQPSGNQEDIRIIEPVDDYYKSPENDSLDSVFIPLKEWKRQKLHDIELKVKRFKSAAQMDAATYLPSDSDYGFKPQTNICPSRTGHTLIFFFKATCPAFECYEQKSAEESPNNMKTEDVKHAIIKTLPEGDMLNRVADGQDKVRASQHPSVSQEGSPSTTAVSTEKDAVESMSVSVHGSTDGPPRRTETPSVESTKLPSKQDELTGWTDVGSISTALAIRKVTDFVKSIKEATGALGSLPPASFYTNSLLTVKGNDSGNLSTTGNKSTTSANETHNAMEQVSADEISTDSASSKNSNADMNQDQEKNVGEVASQSDDSKSDTSHDKIKSHNFASVDAGSRILSASDGTVGAKNVLDSSPDKYLLTPCGSGEARWIDIELSEEVILERFQTANFEYYSSSPQKIVLLGSSSYPATRWNVLGMFDFANVKTLQLFHIEKRVVTRYLKLIFSGKQGEEYYCPISSVRAFGKNLYADWKDALDQQPSLTLLNGQIRRDVKSGNPKPNSRFAPTQKNNQGNKKAIETNSATAKDSEGNGIGGEAPTRHQHGNKNYDGKEARTQSRTGDADKDASNVQEQENPTNAESVEPQTADREGGIQAGSVPTANVDSKSGNAAVGEGTAEQSGESMSEDDQLVLEAVHADTLAPLSRDDNIFRKVTRMLRLLELNQTLTNQYIDTQLAKFAKAILSLSERAEEKGRRERSVTLTLTEQVALLKMSVDELQHESWRHDVLVATLVITIGILVSALLAMWMVTNGGRARVISERFAEPVGDDAVSTASETMAVVERNVERTYPKKKKKKSRDRRCSIEGDNSSSTRALDSQGRSISSIDLVGRMERKNTSGVRSRVLLSNHTGAFDALLGTDD